MTDPEVELHWAEVKASALRALDASILIAGRGSPGVLVQQSPVPWPPAGQHLTLVPGPARDVFWKECQYYAVDADCGDRPEHRQPLDHPVFNPSTKTLKLAVPDGSRAALDATASVRVYRADDQDLKLKLQLRAALRAATRGPRVAELWGRRKPRLTKPSAQLIGTREPNPGQAEALAAMTSEGGYFIWGPPGTGKTTVITAAVRDALLHGRSVLLSSHTHVAVDNVLEALMAEDRRSDRPVLELGVVVRNQPADEGKVMDSVRDHPHLLLDKAAAARVNLVARSDALRQAAQDNQAAPCRQMEVLLRRELDDAGIDVIEVRALDGLMQSWKRLDSVLAQLKPAEDRERAASGRNAACAADLHQFAGAAEDLQAAQERMQQRVTLRRTSELAVERSEQSCRTARQRLVEARASLAAAEAAVQRRWSMVLPGTARRRRRRVGEWELDVAERSEDYGSAKRALSVAENELTLRAQQVEEFQSRLEQAARRARAATDAAAAMAVTAAEERAAKQDADRLRSEADALRQQVQTGPNSASRLAALSESGARDLVAHYDLVLAEVAALDEALVDLGTELKKLQDEYQATRANLLAEAPVIATTLTSLTFNRLLAERRFDVVIIDEAASAEAAAIVYTGSRADRTLALVGDFLQNAPIAEVDDATDDEARQTVAWQSSDVFGLAGIHDRRSAESHPRCVALVRQYRYPSIIGDLVNFFCYAGLLESHRRSEASDGNTITFIDTSHADVHLERRDTSWICRPTQTAALRLAQQIVDGHAPTETLGYLSPYAPQARVMSSQFARADLRVSAGTAHRFQGREFDRVIIDLMEDGEGRWVATADLRGPDRAVSAAKLLNVALTRGKKQIFLIGNWSFVAGCASPGMQALAELEGKANFVLRRVEEWL